MVKDSISDLIISLKNASSVGKSTVVVPKTKLIVSVLESLKKNSYIEDFKIIGAEPKTSIKITLKYENGNPAIHDVRRVSRFSQRIYKGFKDINPVKSGYGMLIMTTPKGILTGVEAAKEKVGGEALFKIW